MIAKVMSNGTLIAAVAASIAIVVAMVVPIPASALDCAACIYGQNSICSLACNLNSQTCTRADGSTAYVDCVKHVPVNMDYCATSTNSSCTTDVPKKCADAYYYAPINLCYNPGGCQIGQQCHQDVVTTSCSGSGSSCPGG